MIRNVSNEGSDAADHFWSTDGRLVDDSVHHHNKYRHGGDNRVDLILGSKIEGSVENEQVHGHPENREGDQEKTVFQRPAATDFEILFESRRPPTMPRLQW